VQVRSRNLSLGVVWRDDAVVVLVDGELDVRSARFVARTLDGLWTQPFTSLWVNLAGASKLDQAGVRVLLAARGRALDTGRGFAIRSPSSEAAHLLESSGVWPLLSGSEPDVPASSSC
jgi:anti-sigma B factor antagonist